MNVILFKKSSLNDKNRSENSLLDRLCYSDILNSDIEAHAGRVMDNLT